MPEAVGFSQPRGFPLPENIPKNVSRPQKNIAFARSEQSVRRVVVGKLPTKNQETLKIAFFGNLLMWIEQAS